MASAPGKVARKGLELVLCRGFAEKAPKDGQGHHVLERFVEGHPQGGRRIDPLALLQGVTQLKKRLELILVTAQLFSELSEKDLIAAAVVRAHEPEQGRGAEGFWREAKRLELGGDASRSIRGGHWPMAQEREPFLEASGLEEVELPAGKGDLGRVQVHEMQVRCPGGCCKRCPRASSRRHKNSLEAIVQAFGHREVQARIFSYLGKCHGKRRGFIDPRWQRGIHFS